MSAQEQCHHCDSSSDLTIEARSYEKDPITVYGVQVGYKTGNDFPTHVFLVFVELCFKYNSDLQGTWQALHLVKRCNNCRASFMYGYSINSGRMKEYDDDCLTRRALGEGGGIVKKNHV